MMSVPLSELDYYGERYQAVNGTAGGLYRYALRAVEGGTTRHRKNRTTYIRGYGCVSSVPLSTTICYGPTYPRTKSGAAASDRPGTTFVDTQENPPTCPHISVGQEVSNVLGPNPDIL